MKALVATILLFTVVIAPVSARRSISSMKAERQRKLSNAFRAASGRVAPPRQYPTPSQALLAFQAALYHARSFSQLMPYLGEKETKWQRNRTDDKLNSYKAKYYVFKPKVEQQLIDPEDRTKAEVSLKGTVYKELFKRYEDKTMRFAMVKEKGYWKFNGSSFFNSKMKAYKRVDTNWQSYFKQASTGQVPPPPAYKSPSKAFLAYQGALLRAKNFSQVVPYLSKEQAEFDDGFVFPQGLTKAKGIKKSLLDYKLKNYYIKPQIVKEVIHPDGKQAYLIIKGRSFSTRDGKMKKAVKSRRYMYKEQGIWRYDGVPQAAVSGRLSPGLHRVAIKTWKH